MGGQLPCPGPAARGQKCILRDKHGIHTLGREAVVLAPMVEHCCPPAGQTLGILPASSSYCLLQHMSLWAPAKHPQRLSPFCCRWGPAAEGVIILFVEATVIVHSKLQALLYQS